MLSREVAAWGAALATVVSLSEAQLRIYQWTGMCLILLVLARQDYRRWTPAMALKFGLVIAICVIFLQRDRIF